MTGVLARMTELGTMDVLEETRYLKWLDVLFANVMGMRLVRKAIVNKTSKVLVDRIGFDFFLARTRLREILRHYRRSFSRSKSVALPSGQCLTRTLSPEV